MQLVAAARCRRCHSSFLNELPTDPLDSLFEVNHEVRRSEGEENIIKKQKNRTKSFVYSATPTRHWKLTESLSSDKGNEETTKIEFLKGASIMELDYPPTQ